MYPWQTSASTGLVSGAALYVMLKILPGQIQQVGGGDWVDWVDSHLPLWGCVSLKLCWKETYHRSDFVFDCSNIVLSGQPPWSLKGINAWKYFQSGGVSWTNVCHLMYFSIPTLGYLTVRIMTSICCGSNFSLVKKFSNQFNFYFLLS